MLLDVLLPGVDGWEVLEELHALGDPVPVIVCSGKNNPHDIQRARELGAVAYLVKPFDIDRLIDVTHEAVRAEAPADRRPGRVARDRRARAGLSLVRPRSVSWRVVSSRSIPARAAPRARGSHARVVHAPGGPLPARVPRAARRPRHPRDDPHAPSRPSRSRCSRCVGCRWTPRSCSATSSCRSWPSACRSGSRPGRGRCSTSRSAATPTWRGCGRSSPRRTSPTCSRRSGCSPRSSRCR